MKIIISDGKEYIRLTDDGLDNDNFVTVVVGVNKEKNYRVDVSLDELLSAIHAFEQKRIMRITRENKYQD